ncbi:hypothetical protein Tcan_01018, partial [Toxocara canis]
MMSAKSNTYECSCNGLLSSSVGSVRRRREGDCRVSPALQSTFSVKMLFARSFFLHFDMCTTTSSYYALLSVCCTFQYNVQKSAYFLGIPYTSSVVLTQSQSQQDHLLQRQACNSCGDNGSGVLKQNMAVM